jgi:hypothetical protein
VPVRCDEPAETHNVGLLHGRQIAVKRVGPGAQGIFVIDPDLMPLPTHDGGKYAQPDGKTTGRMLLTDDRIDEQDLHRAS